MPHHALRAARPLGAALMLATAVGPLTLPRAAGAADEIVVTARKREESLQDVPLSVSAFTATQLQDIGAFTNDDVALQTVGFNTVRQVGRNLDRPTIRGQVAPAVSGEPNASYFIDGVFVTGSISTATLGPIERVEILRGPQSAQFGRATFAGAVNYVTRKPTNEFEGEVLARVGSYETRQLSAWASGPIVEDTLLYFVSAAWDRYGGEWRNSLKADQAPLIQLNLNAQAGDNSRLGGTDTKDAVSKLVWNPTDTAEITFKLAYTEGDDDHYVQLIQEPGEANCFLPTPANMDEPWYTSSGGTYCGTFDIERVSYAPENPFNPFSPDFDAANYFPRSSNLIENLPREGGRRQARINLPDFYFGIVRPDLSDFRPGSTAADWIALPEEPGLRRKTRRALLQYVQDVGEWTVSSRLAWNDDEFNQAYDLDRTEQRYFGGTFNMYAETNWEDQAVEIRAESPSERRLRGAVGVYYYSAEQDVRQKLFVGPGFGRLTAPTTRDVDNRAIFGSLEYDLTERVNLSAEVRVANDKKTIVSPIACGDDPDTPVLEGVRTRDETDADSLTPRFTVRFTPDDDLMLYALVAKGNKPAEFNNAFFRAVTADPCESNVAVQEGATRIEEEKAWTYETGAKKTWADGRVITNLSLYYIDWENQGVFQTTLVGGNPAQITRNAGKSRVRGLEFESSARLTDYLDVRFNYGLIDGEFVEYDDPFFADTTGVGLDADGNLINGSNNVKGHQLPSSPKHSFVAAANYERPLNADLDWFARTTYSYEMRRYTAPDNFIRIPTRNIWNVRAGLSEEDWTLTLFVNNLLDEITPSSIFSFPYLQGIVWNNGTDNAGNPDGSPGTLVNGTSAAVTPGRIAGLEFVYRFGN